MATLKHIASKNSDYSAIEAYLIYQHDEFTGKQLLDHRKLPGEKYFRGYKMSEREADALLRKDLNKFIALFSDLNPSDALLMGVLSYNIGPGAVKKSTVYRKLKSGNRDIYKSYIFHCLYKGKWHKGLHTLRCQEFAALFAR